MVYIHFKIRIRPLFSSNRRVFIRRMSAFRPFIRNFQPYSLLFLLIQRFLSYNRVPNRSFVRSSNRFRPFCNHNRVCNNLSNRRQLRQRPFFDVSLFSSCCQQQFLRSSYHVSCVFGDYKHFCIYCV